MSLPLQEVLKGKYEILEKIGEGGIGSVYKVQHRLLEEVRVIKVLRPEAASKDELRERFLHEARMAIRLKHPNIAQLHDFSIAEDGRAYIVMEFIDGVALDALIEASIPPSIDLALEIAAQGLAALHYLHEHDFVHRDVSPDNLMLTSAFDGRPLVKLIDLGIARHLGADVRLTATGVFLGKARYSSPEQFSAGGETPAEVDRRGDIYSFGVMLYELLTGAYPMRGGTFAELAGSHLFQQPREFSETDPENRLPDGLRQAVLKAMAKAPEERFATAAELSQELARYRDPEAELREEFDRTVEIATTAMPRIAGKGRPGSTQDRLNAQFGMDATGAPAAADIGETVVLAPRKTLAQSVREIATLISRGRGRRARRALDRALADHGGAESLLELRQAVDRLAESRGGRRGLPLAGLVAAAAVIVAGGLGAWWWLGRTPAADPAAATAAAAPPALMVTATPRWDSAEAAGEPSPLAAAVAEPPPAESAPPVADETGVQPDATQPQTPGGAGPAGAADPDASQAEAEAAAPPAPQPAQLEITREIFELGAVGVVPPVLLELPPPTVPEDARRLNEPLTVVVKVLVDETGEVGRALIASGPSFRRKYRDAALEAAERARFRPARRGNAVGRMWTEVRVVFEPE